MWEGTFYLIIVLMMGWTNASGQPSVQLLSLELENEKACQLAMNQMDRQMKNLSSGQISVLRYSLTCVPKNEKKEND